MKTQLGMALQFAGKKLMNTRQLDSIKREFAMATEEDIRESYAELTESCTRTASQCFAKWALEFRGLSL